MSQRKAKEYRRAMEQYQGVAADVDDLKRRIGAMEVRHRREDQMAEAARRRARAAAREQQEQERVRAQEQAEAERREASRRRNERRRRIVRRRRITALACMAALVLAVVWAVAMACAAVGADEPETILPDPVAVTPITTPAAVLGEDPLEAEKIEAALLEQGYFSEEIPLSYDLQDVMRTACAEYGCPYTLALAVAEVESHFDMDAVGAVGEVGIMQLNPGPQNTYWINLEAETGEDPTTPAGNIICGAYLLGTHMANYGEPEKALMAYNMGPAGTRCEAVARARFHRWQAPGRSRVVHPAHGSIVVPHTSNLAAILNAAEVWRCDWATILDAEVWAADPAEPVAKMPIHIK